MHLHKSEPEHHDLHQWSHTECGLVPLYRSVNLSSHQMLTTILVQKTPATSSVDVTLPHQTPSRNMYIYTYAKDMCIRCVTRRGQNNPRNTKEPRRRSVQQRTIVTSSANVTNPHQMPSLTLITTITLITLINPRRSQNISTHS